MTDVFQALSDKAPRPETAEVKLDLGSESEAAAIEKLGHVLTYCVKSGAASLYVSFAPAKPGETTSLFQPVARAISRAKASGEVALAIPMVTPESAGIFVRMARG